MKNRITWLSILALAVLLATPAQGQSIEETLQDLVSENAKGYLGPFATGFGTGMNSGTFRTAKPHKILGFDLTLNFTSIPIPDADLTYDFYFPDQVDFPFEISEEITPWPAGVSRTVTVPLNGASLYPGDRTSATFFGANEEYLIQPDAEYAKLTTEAKLSDLGVDETVITLLSSAIATSIDDNLTITTPPGIDFPSVFTLMPQASVGLPFETELTLGGFTVPIGDSDEDLSFSRFGVKIGLNQFIPTIPLIFPAISAGFYSSSMDLAGIITAKNTILTLQASKSVPMLTVYGGFGIESSSIKVNVDDPNTGENLFKFSLSGDNSFRTIIGFRLKLLVLSINADYNIGEYSAVSAGIGLTLR
ncbi:MAG: DUF6588 family protein [Candidatus Neomarinimicrobiota bacterium]